MKIYKSQKIPVSRFCYILNTGDSRALMYDFDIYDDNEDLKYDGDEDLDDIFKTIYYKYCILIGDNNQLTKMRKEAYIKEKEAEMKFVNTSMLLYVESENEGFITLLNSTFPSYSIDLKKDISVQVERNIRKLKGLRNKINIKKIDYAKRYKKEGNEPKKELDADAEAILLENALELKYSIDVDSISLGKWCKMINLARKKAKKHGENQNNSRRRVKRIK
jgi:hypothetical protein